MVSKIRKIFQTREVGHAGTLDPFATGVLICALGKATKILEYIQHQDKEYIATLTLGQSSDTYDCEGVIEEIPSTKYLPTLVDKKSLSGSRSEIVIGKIPNREKVETILKQFIGEISQVPPRFSAIKVDGVKSYDRARKGEDFELPARKVTIESIEILEYVFPLLKIKVACSTGTYIRSLGHDIGEKLGTHALLSGLERTRIGNICVEQCHTLEKLSSVGASDLKPLLIWDANILPLETIELTSEQIQKLKLGQFITIDTNSNNVELFGISENKPIAILERKEALWKTKKLLIE